MKAWLFAIALAAASLAVLLVEPKGEPCLARYASDMKSRTRNQRHNAMLAAKSLNGAVIKPGEVFSFNKRVGSWSRDVGYRKAPVSYNGQLVPSWGGGVCQTSTTLYNAALMAGLDIVERHPHRFATGYCPPGRDAAVAFSGIDLKFKNSYSFPLRIEAIVKHDALQVSLLGTEVLESKPKILTEIRDERRPMTFAANVGLSVGRVRNTGKNGYEVATYRLKGGRKELISVDDYPVVHRIVEYR